MARTLETLTPGTSVFAGPTLVGTVSGLYTEAGSRGVELVVVHWDARAEDVAVPSAEIESIDDAGVHLMRNDATQCDDLAPFNASAFPTMERFA
jgi:hypothetical protein